MAKALKATGAEAIRWDLSELFASPTDPKLEATMARSLERAKAFEAKYKGTEHAAYEAEVAKAKARYDVAQEKCDDMKGAEKSACKKQAKADETKALADAKANRGKKVASTAEKPAK